MERKFNLCLYSIAKFICFDLSIVAIVILFTGTENLNSSSNIIIPVFLIRWALGFGYIFRLEIDNEQIICYSIFGKKTIKLKFVKKIEFDEMRLGKFPSLGFTLYYIDNSQSEKIKKRRIYIKYLSEKDEIKRTIEKKCRSKKIEFKNLLNKSKA